MVWTEAIDVHGVRATRGREVWNVFHERDLTIVVVDLLARNATQQIPG